MIARYSATALVAAALFAPSGAESPTHRAATGTSWVKTFSESSEFTLDSITQRMNGNEIDAPGIEMEGSLVRAFEIIDDCIEAEDGVLGSGTRSFEEVTGSCKIRVGAGGELDEREVYLTSRLEGHELSYERDGDDYEFSYGEDSDGDDDLLETLIEDADFQLLVPEEDVKEGDSWKVDLAEGRAFFAPGGQLTWEPSEAPAPMPNSMDAVSLISVSMVSLADCSEEITGTIEATWKSTREEDGHEVAVIALELDAELSANLDEELMRMAGAVDLDAQDHVFDCNWEVEGTGELLWDLEAGHFLSLDMDCEIIIEFEMSWEEPFGKLEIEAEVSGETKIEARAE